MTLQIITTATSIDRDRTLEDLSRYRAFLALADEDDDYHSVAKSLHAQLLGTRAQLLTSNFVLAETYTLIREGAATTQRLTS